MSNFGNTSAIGEELAPQKLQQEPNPVARSAADAGAGVVDSATKQGKDVASEAGRQARSLYGQMRAEVDDQAAIQQKRAVGGLHALGDEVAKMAEQGDGSGLGSQVAQQASQKINEVARWLDDHEPGQVFDEIKSYARRNPGTFLMGAAALGIVAGRLTKNLADASAGIDGSGNTRRFEPQAGAHRSTVAAADPGPSDSALRPAPAERRDGLLATPGSAHPEWDKIS